MEDKNKSLDVEDAKITRYGSCFLAKFSEDNEKPSILHIQGSPEEMGKAHGFLLADKIEEFFSSYMTPVCALFGGWIPGSNHPPTLEQISIGKIAVMNLAIKRCLPAIENEASEYLRELKALHEGLQEAGSTLALNEVILGNSMPEASWIFSNCSNFVAWNSNTVDGKLIHAVNLDEETFDVMQKFIEILVVKPNNGNSFIGMHLMGNISPNSWMNDKGLSYGEMTCNSVNVKWPQIPHLMHGRKVAQYGSSIEEAFDILEKTGGTTGWANLIALGTRNKSYAVDIELTGTEIAIRYEDPNFPDVIWQTNTFRCYPGNQGYSGDNLVKGQIEYWAQLRDDDKPDYINKTITWSDVDTLDKWKEKVVCPRYQKYLELLTNYKGKIDVETAIKVQSDEVLTIDRIPGKIQISPPCEHLNGEIKPIFSNKIYSVYSCIFVPEDGNMWVAIGNNPAQAGTFWNLNLNDHLNMMKDI